MSGLLFLSDIYGGVIAITVTQHDCTRADAGVGGSKQASGWVICQISTEVSVTGVMKGNPRIITQRHARLSNREQSTAGIEHRYRTQSTAEQYRTEQLRAERTLVASAVITLCSSSLVVRLGRHTLLVICN